MADFATEWMVTLLTAKVFADLVRREHGFATPNAVASARSPTEIDLAYLAALAACATAVRYAGLETALPVCILIRLASLAGPRILVAANQTFLELFLLVLSVRLLDRPSVLSSVVQLLTVSVWMYSAFQKLHHGEYRDGSFFYMMFQHPGMSGRWARLRARVPKIHGYFGSVDPGGETLCRDLATAALMAETVLPLLAFATAGTVFGALVLAAAAFGVGVVSKETNFMVTNLLTAGFFLMPFSSTAFLAVTTDLVASVVVGWCLVWPPLHAVLTRRLHFSSWKLGGWGMYATHPTTVKIINPAGELVAPQAAECIPLGILRVCGACDIVWLREYARRAFLEKVQKEPTTGLVFHWYRIRDRKFVTECRVLPNEVGATVTAFEIADDTDVETLHRCVASLHAHGYRTAKSSARTPAFT